MGPDARGAFDNLGVPDGPRRPGAECRTGLCGADRQASGGISGGFAQATGPSGLNRFRTAVAGNVQALHRLRLDRPPKDPASRSRTQGIIALDEVGTGRLPGRAWSIAPAWGPTGRAATPQGGARGLGADREVIRGGRPPGLPREADRPGGSVPGTPGRPGGRPPRAAIPEARSRGPRADREAGPHERSALGLALP